MDWLFAGIVVVPLFFVIGMAVYSRKYVRGVADYLAAGRVAGRYVISVGDMASALGLISLVALAEEQYQCGLSIAFWNAGLVIPVGLIMSLTGFVIYRFRETRALSFGQFLEMRYSRSFRIFAAGLRTMAEMLTNAIGPAIAARFFIYFLGLPHVVSLFGLSVPTFPLLMAVCLSLSLLVVLPGGRVSLIITDCLQGLFFYVVFIVFIIYIFTKISFVNDVAPLLLDRVEGESFLNPFDVSRMRDFNLFALLVLMINAVVNRGGWMGNDVSNAGRTPHEQKMAGMLGAWRQGFGGLMCMLVAILVITLMNHARFAPEARGIRLDIINQAAGEAIKDPEKRARIAAAVERLPAQSHRIGVDPPLSRASNPDTRYLEVVQGALGTDKEANRQFQEMRTLYYQTMLPTTMRHALPGVMMALFALLMLFLMISTDDSRIFNSSATIVQDVVMPLRSRPFGKREHILWLRLASVGVCVFFFFGSLVLSQLDYINMLLTILASIWLGGAGPVVLFGLYSRFGTTAGAWAALFSGTGISVAGIVLQQHWAAYFYPWLDQLGWVESLDAFLQAVSGPFHPYVVWAMNPVKFPVNSREITFIAIICSFGAYILLSLATRKQPFNLERMLHRGAYRMEGGSASGERAESPRGLKSLFRRIITITPEYTRGDRIIAYFVFIYSFVYQFLICFVGVIAWNLASPFTPGMWTWFFYLQSVIIASIVGAASTVWFFAGGVVDLRRMLRDLRGRRDENPLDDGWVDGQVAQADKALVEQVEGAGNAESPPPDKR